MAMHQYAGPLWVVDHEAVLIDLGDMSNPDPGPGPQRLTAGARRVLLTAGLTLLLLASLGASAIPAPVLGRPLWAADISLAGFSLGTQYVTGADPGTRTVIGREITTGEPRWHLDVDDPPQYAQDLTDTVLAVLTKDQPSEDEPTGQQTITLLVGGPGRLLTRITGNQFGQTVAGDRLLVATDDPAAALACPDGEQCSDVTAYDLPTSAPAWRSSMPGDLVPGLGVDGEARFATVRQDGSVQLRDPASGASVDEFRLPPYEGERQIAMFGDLLVTATRGPAGVSLAAYHTQPVAAAWELRVPASATVTDATAQFYLHGCGRLICLHLDGGNAIVDQGGVLRGFAGLEVVGQAGGLLVAVPTTERGGSPVNRRVVTLLSATDAQAVGTFADTVPVRWSGSGGRALLASQGSAGTGFVLVGADGRPRALGAIAGIDLSCAARGAYLACVDPVGRLRVWRLPPA